MAGYAALLRWKEGKSPYSKDGSVGAYFLHRDDCDKVFTFTTAEEAEADGATEVRCHGGSVECVGVIHI